MGKRRTVLKRRNQKERGSWKSKREAAGEEWKAWERQQRRSCANPRAHSQAPKRQTTPQPRHRCVKVQMLKSTSISVPFPTSPGRVTICPLGLRPEKNGTMKASTVLTTFSDSDKNLPEPHVEDWKCSLLLLFNFNLMVGRIRANTAEAFFAQTVGTLIPISSHRSPKLRSEKKATWEQKQGCRKLQGSQYWGIFSHLVSSLTWQYSNTQVNSNLIYLLFLFLPPF